MGMDFSALLHYEGPTGSMCSAIDQLEIAPSHPVTDAVVEHGRDQGFAFAQCAKDSATWRTFADWETTLSARPQLPDLSFYLQLPSDFCLTFGHDAVWIYHTLRWIFFVSEEKWQTVMLDAMRYFSDLFKASECIITSDFNPAIIAFREGHEFSRALHVAEPEHGEVASFDELYEELEDDSDLAFRRVDDDAPENTTDIADLLEGQILEWPKDKPLPDGWQRPTVWDSKGYWRLRLED
jgi:hypothetical protein